MAQWLREQASLPEILSSISNNDMEALQPSTMHCYALFLHAGVHAGSTHT